MIPLDQIIPYIEEDKERILTKLIKDRLSPDVNIDSLIEINNQLMFLIKMLNYLEDLEEDIKKENIEKNINYNLQSEYYDRNIDLFKNNKK